MLTLKSPLHPLDRENIRVDIVQHFSTQSFPRTQLSQQLSQNPTFPATFPEPSFPSNFPRTQHSQQLSQNPTFPEPNLSQQLSQQLSQNPHPPASPGRAGRAGGSPGIAAPPPHRTACAPPPRCPPPCRRAARPRARPPASRRVEMSATAQAQASDRKNSGQLPKAQGRSREQSRCRRAASEHRLPMFSFVQTFFICYSFKLLFCSSRCTAAHAPHCSCEPHCHHTCL